MSHEELTTEQKNAAISLIAKMAAKEMDCTELEAVSALQSSAAKKGREDLLSDLSNYKSTLIDELFIL